MILPPIFTICNADTTIRSYLSTGGLIRMYLTEAPEGVVAPFVVYSEISGYPENNLSDRPDHEVSNIQVDIYADNALSVRNIASAIETAIELDAYVVGYNGESRDEDTKLFRFSFDVDWILNR